ncbi:MAG: hypothetical protein K0S81_3749 [Rhodospirillales bacterium]|nr:hypothetical protein [Rhodospirillales bacterium]
MRHAPSKAAGRDPRGGSILAGNILGFGPFVLSARRYSAWLIGPADADVKICAVRQETQPDGLADAARIGRRAGRARKAALDGVSIQQEMRLALSEGREKAV